MLLFEVVSFFSRHNASRRSSHLANERLLVFRVEDEVAVRARLRKLGYVLPPPV